jgi:arsenate reductase-like glutaredoxin family protein
MSRYNDTYLKPALSSLKANAESFINSADSATKRVNAESVSITDKSKAELTYKHNISTGFKYALILGGFGVLIVLAGWSAAIVINALKAETLISPKVAEIQQQLDKSTETLENLSTAVNSQNQNHQTNLENLVTEVRNMKASVTESQTKLIKELAVVRSNSNSVGKNENSKPENYSGYSIETFNLNEKSQSCHDNLSFSQNCNDVIKFENGWSYSGAWRNGMPNGDGKITFPGGAELQANF